MPRVAIVHANHGKKWFAASLTSRPHLPIKETRRCEGQGVCPPMEGWSWELWGYVCGRVCVHVYVSPGLCWELSLGYSQEGSPKRDGWQQ